MNLTRPAPRLTISLKVSHDIHIGNPLWVERLPDLKDQTPEHLYIIYVPPEERDKVMGMFIECWDALEGGLHHLFRRLSRSSFDVTNILISTFNGTKPVADATYALAELTLQPDQLKTLSSLLDRVRKVAAKRNRIIHGHWVMGLTYESVEGPHGVVLRPIDGKWERVYQPVSPTESEALIMEKEQKVSAKYRFSMDSLMEVSKTLLLLVDDLSAFNVAVEETLPPEEPT